MPVSPTFRTFVLDQLGRVAPRVRGRSMFGGVGIYAGAQFFALIADSTLYFKVDDSNRPDFEARGMGPFRPYGPGGEVMQYYEVPEDVLEDIEALRHWADKAIAVAARNRLRPRRGASSRHQRVDLLPHLLQPLGDLLARAFVPRSPARPVHCLHQPAHGAVHVGHRAAQRALYGVVHPLEDVVHDILVLVEERAPRVGDLVDLLAGHVAGGDESLIFEPLERRVDSAGRRRVAAAQLLLKLFHHFVAVAWLVLEELEDHVLHVPRLEPLTAPAARAGPEKAAGPETEGERFPAEMPRHACFLRVKM